MVYSRSSISSTRSRPLYVRNHPSLYKSFEKPWQQLPRTTVSSQLILTRLRKSSILSVYYICLEVFQLRYICVPHTLTHHTPSHTHIPHTPSHTHSSHTLTSLTLSHHSLLYCIFVKFKSKKFDGLVVFRYCNMGTNKISLLRNKIQSLIMDFKVPMGTSQCLKH